jgi:PAS domain S-box-containing protein
MLEASDVLLHAVGMRREALLGRDLFDVFPDDPDDPAARGVRELGRSLDRVLRERVPDVMAVQPYPLRPPHREGEASEERYWRPLNVPLLGPDGEVVCIIHRAEEVTEFVRPLERSDGDDRGTAEIYRRAHELEVANRELREARARESEAERRASEILESITDAFLTLDREWCVTFLNGEAERLLKRKRQDLLGRSLWEVFPDVVGTVFERRYRQAREEGHTVSFEAYYEPFGAWFAVRAYPSAEGLSVYFLDITDRKQSEEAAGSLLRELEERDRLLAIAGRTARLGGWLVDLATGTVHWTDEVCAIHDVPPGTRVSLEEAIDFYAPEWRPVIAEHVAACVEAGTPYDLELEIVSRKGRRVWVRTIGEAVRARDGTITRIHGSFQDITERRRAEMELAAAEAHYRRLVETSPDGIIALDLEGRFTEVNPAAAELTGRPAGTLLGRRLAEIVAPEDLAEVTQLRRERLETGRDVLDHEVRILRPSGERRLVRLRTTLIREAGVVIGTHGIVRDITEERARERHLRRAERLASVGTLIGGVAHELNTPLHAIRNFAELLLMEPRGTEDREALEIIQREADRAAKVVADLRLLARETQEAERGRAAVDLNDVVRHVLKVRRYSLETGNIEIREDLADDLPPVLADRGNVEQVVLNLVVNAEQAMANQLGERRLILRTRRTPGGSALHVVDSGPGIPPQNLERIFDPFFTTKAPGEGTGLGLSLVHNIVAEHGGAIHVDSEVGKGTAFRIELPRAPGEKAGAGGGAAPAPQRVLRVLVVDDEPAVRRISVRFLEHLGHEVETAVDGAEALELLARREYDVIVSDLRMPGLSGEELLQRLRGDGRGLERRLIFVTGDAASTDAGRIVAEAGVPVLVKPVRLQELARVLEYAAGAGGSERGRTG